MASAALVAPATICAQQANLEAPPTGIVDQTVKVTYSGPGDEGDEMTIGTAAGVELLGTNPADLSGDGEGYVDLLMPSLPGLYTILYRGDEGILATKRIQVTDPDFQLSTAREAVADTNIRILWKGISTGNGMIAIRNADGEVLTSEAVPANTTGGSVILTTPTASGTYEVSYLDGQEILASMPLQVTGGDETHLAVPSQVMARLNFEVAFSGPFSNRDRVVIVPSGADEPILDYAYLNPGYNSAVLNAPSDAGPFDVQYRNRQGEVLASAGMQVLPAPEEMAQLTVVARGDYELSENTALEIILDASGSMLQDQAGEDRIDIAKDTLLEFMKSSVPPGMPVALRAFGHIEEGSCESELLIPMSPFDYDGMAPIVKEIEAINLAKTPLADSLQMVRSDLASAPGERIVVLLTDGKETCDGMPAQVIQNLSADGMDIRVDIVGYNIEDQDIRQDFESWAALGNGRYYDATQAEELSLALDNASSIPFSIYDGTRLVATGVSGETAIQVPEGTYDVVFRRDGQPIRKSVTVSTDERTQVMIP
ncbi:MAG: VWA domain-containing protein [Verrucomicrobiota bacterium JB023]|nr:VWA domain-containing protein [Verrucomicrobiota bacterium JB023]